MKSISVVIAATLIATSGFDALALQRPIDDKLLADWLMTGAQGLKEGAIASILKIAPEKRSLLVEEALVAELTRLNDAHNASMARYRAGQPLEIQGERITQYRFDLAHAASQSKNPIVIPALVGVLGAGPPIARALAKFGEQAVEPIAEIARNDHPVRETVQYAIEALQNMVDSGAMLSANARGMIRDVARQRLEGKQYFSWVAAASKLAVATGDPVLRRRVEQLVADPAELSRMGIDGEAAVRHVTKAASEALKRGR